MDQVSIGVAKLGQFRVLDEELLPVPREMVLATEVITGTCVCRD